jgi:hypothetical protein
MNVRYKALALGIVASSFNLFSTAGAADVAGVLDASPTCHEVTRRIAVYPRGGNPSKSLRAPRFETRAYQVCAGKKVLTNKDSAVAQRS